MALTRVVVNRAAMHQLLESPASPVAKFILGKTLKVERRAKHLCPVDTGRLRSSITHGMASDARGIYGWVGTDVEYGKYVEMGTSRMAAQPFLRPALSEAG